MRLTNLAEFHNAVDIAWCPFLEALWTLTSRQYCFWELALSQFLSTFLHSSVVWTGNESKHLRSDAPPIKAISMQSTGASLFGVDETPSTSCSSWLGSECHSLDCAESWFKPVEGHLFNIPFMLLWLLLLGIITVENFCSASTIHFLNFTKQQQLLWAQRLKRKFNQKVVNLFPGQYLSQPGMLCASSHHGRQYPSIPLLLSQWDSTQRNGVFLRL